jgi:hypothetical protein
MIGVCARPTIDRGGFGTRRQTMLITERDCQRGGERFPIPTLGEVEGRLIVSEVVACCCLRQLLADTKSAALPAIRRRIRRTLQAHCRREKLRDEDTQAAIDYALELLDAAVEAAGKRPTNRKIDRTLSAFAASREAPAATSGR